LLCLGALPFGVALFGLGILAPAEAWLEGGWPMYAVVALGAVATLVNASSPARWASSASARACRAPSPP
jgi:hypothetical protein